MRIVLLGMEEDRASLLRIWLGELGCKVSSMAEENLLVESIEGRADLLIWDLSSTEPSRIELISQFKSWSKGISVLVLSQDMSAQTRIRVFQAGSDSVLPSPPLRDEFMAVVKNLLAARETYLGLEGEIERLRNQISVKESFFLMAAHDLSGPLACIHGYLHLIDDVESPISAETKGDYIRIAMGSCNSMGDIIADIKDMNLMEEGRFKLKCRPFDPAGIVRNALEGIQSVSDTLTKKISVVVDEKIGEVRGDESLIQRVVSNLLQNAIRHCGPYGIVIVHVGPSSSPAGVRIAVDNSGEPVAPDLCEKLFMMYESGCAGGGHWGLGLAFCRAAVRAHGGDIWLEKPPSFEGARFVFTLPAHPSATSQGGVRDPAVHGTG
jgi:signal transduction histidine kinase